MAARRKNNTQHSFLEVAVQIVADTPRQRRQTIGLCDTRLFLIRFCDLKTNHLLHSTLSISFRLKPFFSNGALVNIEERG